MSMIKPQLGLNSIDPNSTSVLHDPWCFEIPIIFKPTFYNMDFANCNLQVSDLLLDDNWNTTTLYELLSSNLNPPIGKLGQVISSSSNSWVWMPNTSIVTLMFSIYHGLNAGINFIDEWQAWNNLLRLNSSPRSKFLI